LGSTILTEKEARTNVNLLASLDFIISLGFGLIMPLFPLYLSMLSGGSLEIGLQVGILFSAFVFSRALLAAPFGNLSDRIGRKRLILIGSFLYAVLAVLFTVPDTWFGLLFVRGLQGVASAMVWPVSEALVIDSTPPKLVGSSMGKIVMSSNLGMVVGPFVGGALFGLAHGPLGFSEMDSYKFPFYFTAVLALGGAIMVWAFVRDAKAPKGVRSRMSLGQLLHPDGMDRQGLRNLRALYANAAMEGFAFASIGPLMVIFLSFRFPELGADSIPIIIGLASGLGAIIAFPAGRFADRFGRKRMFVIGGYVAFIGTILIPFGWLLWVVIVFMAMRSMAFQVSSPALRALQAETVPEATRGRLIGMLESISNSGSVIGGPVGGLLMDMFLGADLGFTDSFDGSVLPFLISGLLGLFTVSLVHIMVKEKDRTRLDDVTDPPTGTV